MASKKFQLNFAQSTSSNQNTCDKSEIQQKLKELVRILARETARKHVLEGVLS